jgi:alkylation response protein AidB-like acyl-CoA dehydrogenase
MQFAFSEEQDLIRESVREFLAEHGASTRVRAAIATEHGYDQDTWRAMIEMGWTGLPLPERHGGSALGNVELVIVQQELGRRLTPSPYFASVCMAARAVQAAGTEAQCAEILPLLASGKKIGALAVTGRNGRAGLDAIGVQLSHEGSTYRLSGEASFVVSGHVAQLLIVAARAPGSRGADSVSLMVLPADAPGVRVERLVMMDETRRCARVSFDRVSVAREAILGEPGQSGVALERALQLAQISLAAEQTGGAEGALEMTVSYAKERVQFGRAIGSFQAVKHRLADMMVQIEAAKSAVYYAAVTADEQSEELPEAAALVKAYCSDAFSNCAGNAIQLHGGIGFTWEHDAHLYFKRARSSSTLLGDAAYHREQIAQRLNLVPSECEGRP